MPPYLCISLVLSYGAVRITAARTYWISELITYEKIYLNRSVHRGFIAILAASYVWYSLLWEYSVYMLGLWDWRYESHCI